MIDQATKRSSDKVLMLLKSAQCAMRALILCGLCLCSVFAYGQTELTTSGTDFWFAFMKNYLEESEATFTVFITSDEPTNGLVEMPLLGWSQAFTTEIGVTTAIDVPVIAENELSGLVSDKGVHLTSVDPVNVYAINYVPNSADASRILPKSFLDIDYVVNAEEGQTNITDTLRSELVIVATEDGTEVEINPACDMLGGALQNVPFTIQLDQGETYLLQATELQDVSGTTITGTAQSGDCRPFAVFGGAECSFTGANCSVCDHIFDHVVPSELWGTEYLMGTFDTFISSYTFKVTAAQDGTQVFVDGVPSFMLNAGETQEVNSNSAPVYVSASDRVRVVQYMESAGCTINGDPTMTTLNTLDQTMDQVTFATIVSDLITEHHLQVIVPSTATDIVFLDGVLVPEAAFAPFAGNDQYAFADLDIPEGSHTLSCEQRFIAYVYGLGDAESYAYSTGATLLEPLAPVPNVFCSLNQVVLETAENYTNIWWSTLEEPEIEIFSGQPFIIDQPIQNQVYILHGDNFLSGCSEEELFSVESPSPLLVDIPEASLNLCLFQDFTFNPTVTPAGSGYVYEWSEAGAFSVGDEANGVITPTEDGLYYLDVTSLSGCATGRDSVEVNILGNDVIFLDAFADTVHICEGDLVTLEANTGLSQGVDFFNGVILDPLLWADVDGLGLGDLCGSIGGSSAYFDGATGRLIETVDFDMSMGGAVSFAIKISDGSDGCDGADFGEDVLLQFSINGGGTWTDIITLFEDQYPDFETVEATLPAAAQVPAVRFRWIQPNFTAADEDLWALDNVAISSFGDSGNAYSWSSAAAIDNPAAQSTSSQPTESTYFFVETSSAGCVIEDSVFVEVQPTFDLEITADTTICFPLAVPLLVTSSEPGFYTYAWDNEGFLNVPNTANPIATPQANTAFTVEVSSAVGCSNTATVNVDLLSTFAPVISPDDFSVCEGPVPLEIVLEGDPSEYTFDWSPAAIVDDPTAQLVNVFPEGGSFNTMEVVVTNTVTGCTNTATQNLSANFAVFDLPRDTVICESEGFVLNYDITNTMFNAVIWTNPLVLDNANTAFPTITVPDFNGDLIVTYFVPGAGGCSVSDTITVTTQPLAYSAPEVLSNCPAATVQASITGGFTSIAWVSSPNLNSVTPEFPIFSNDEDEVFYFDLEGPGGCLITDSIEIVVNLPAAFQLTQSAQVCEGEEVTLDNPIMGMSYLWSTGAMIEDIVVTSSGTYSVQVTDSAACVISDDIVVETLSPAAFDIIGDVTACAGDSISLTADVVSDNYLWSDNSMMQSASFNLTGLNTVWVEVIDANNCVFRDSLDITFTDPLVLTLSAEGSICDDTGSALMASASDVTYLWETGETTNQITVADPGWYSLTITDANNCVLIDSVMAASIDFPDLMLDTFMCQGGSVVFQPQVSDVFMLDWSTGEQGLPVEIEMPGLYELLITYNNCDTTIAFELGLEPSPTLEIVAETAFCSQNLINEPYLVLAQSDGLISWLSDMQQGDALSITQSGVYPVVASNGEGCSVTDSITIVDTCPDPLIYIPNAFTPDGDGINDSWRAEIFGQVNEYELLIFDRDGHVVFESQDPSQPWRGGVNGGTYYAQDGVYNYLITYSVTAGERGIVRDQLRGVITVLR